MTNTYGYTMLPVEMLRTWADRNYENGGYAFRDLPGRSLLDILEHNGYNLRKAIRYMKAEIVKLNLCMKLADYRYNNA